MNELQELIGKRRTFAIISHPDAGKTTLTEKLLLYGGAIHLAGSVKSRKTDRYATSDWMEIEKQRGISVTSSVMQFNYGGYCVNILDTPGHQDFSEDTYRTLMAADSAVMLLDGAKGVEPQTIKLFQVCRRRGIPIFTFINKMDRASKHPFDLMDELEKVLGIRSCPMNWPIGIHGDFKGVYNRESGSVELYNSDGTHGMKTVARNDGSMDEAVVSGMLGQEYCDTLRDEIEMLDVAGDEFDLERVLSGELTPVFFGSAMNNFGVQTFLEAFLKLAPAPSGKQTSGRYLEPDDDTFSAFVFKIQANMDPAHRDRLAFMRICSGKYEAGMTAWHVRAGREIRLARSQQFMAQERSTVEVAYPGDIIGVFDPGMFRIGDTIMGSKTEDAFEGIPMFSPEYFARVRAADSMKRKQFTKGLDQLSEEGAVQVFKEVGLGVEEYIIGAVGVLQFEVLTYRLQNEYRVDVILENMPIRYARWVENEELQPDDALKALNVTSTTRFAEDRVGRKVMLFENGWSIDWAKENNKTLKLAEIM